MSQLKCKVHIPLTNILHIHLLEWLNSYLLRSFMLRPRFWRGGKPSLSRLLNPQHDCTPAWIQRAKYRAVPTDLRYYSSVRGWLNTLQAYWFWRVCKLAFTRQPQAIQSHIYVKREKEGPFHKCVIVYWDCSVYPHFVDSKSYSFISCYPTCNQLHF